MDRYGDAIEYDLHARAGGLDLLDFFRGRYSWRKLLVILDRLPSGSAYWAARADDDEAAMEHLKTVKPGVSDKPSPPALAEMNLTNQLLMSVVDMLVVVTDRIERSAGSKPATPKPMLRPSTAIQRAAALKERMQVSDLVAQVYEAQARAEATTKE